MALLHHTKHKVFQLCVLCRVLLALLDTQVLMALKDLLENQDQKLVLCSCVVY